VQVAKAEKEDFRNWWLNRPPQGTSLDQLLALQQQQQQQQVQSFDATPASQSRRSSSLFASVEGQAGTPAASKGDGQHSPSLLTSSSSSSAPDSQQLWRWVLAEVGLAAQKQLSTGIPSVTTVAALNGPSPAAATSSSDALASATVAVVRTAEGAAAAVKRSDDPSVSVEADAGNAGSSSSSSSSVTGSGSSRVTKNQDPGLPVDANAIANPGGYVDCSMCNVAVRLYILSPHPHPSCAGQVVRLNSVSLAPLQKVKMREARAPGVNLCLLFCLLMCPAWQVELAELSAFCLTLAASCSHHPFWVASCASCIHKGWPQAISLLLLAASAVMCSTAG
jgi:hypothetical protein